MLKCFEQKWGIRKNARDEVIAGRPLSYYMECAKLRLWDEPPVILVGETICPGLTKLIKDWQVVDDDDCIQRFDYFLTECKCTHELLL